MYKRENVKWREEGDEAIIFYQKESRIFRLNETAKVVWMMIEEKTVEEIADSIAEKYSIEAKDVIDDVNMCIDNLLKGKLLKEVHPNE